MTKAFTALLSWAVTLLAGIVIGHGWDLGPDWVYVVLSAVAVAGSIVLLVLTLRTFKKEQSQ